MLLKFTKPNAVRMIVFRFICFTILLLPEKYKPILYHHCQMEIAFDKKLLLIEGSIRRKVLHVNEI
jgi:hypothetical protein